MDESIEPRIEKSIELYENHSKSSTKIRLQQASKLDARDEIAGEAQDFAEIKNYFFTSCGGAISS